MRPPRKRTLAVAAVVLVLAAAAGAFMLVRGNSNPSAQSARPFAQEGGGLANSAAFQQFRKCMANNGVTLSAGQRPDPTDPTVQKARQACAKYAPPRPSGRPGGGGAFGTPPAASAASDQSRTSM